MLFSSCIYFVIRISQGICSLEFCLSSLWLYYSSRIILIVIFFLLHFALMHTSLQMSNNLMISQRLIDTIYFPTENVTFYIYDDDIDNYKTAVSMREHLLPIYKKILSDETITPEKLSITCSDGDFIITDGDRIYRYPCKYHRRHGYFNSKASEPQHKNRYKHPVTP